MEYIDQIKGLFEIHITVNPCQILELRMFCAKHKVKPILAVAEYGENPNQLMISKWTTGLAKQAIQKAEETAELMTKEGLQVVRVKVEAMSHNQGVPKESNDDSNPSHYFEFHLKVPADDDKSWKQIEKVAVAHGGAVSFNAFKEKIKALVTLRFAASRGYSYAETMKEKLVTSLIQEQIPIGDEIQKEFSVYDTNPQYDAGWLPTL